MRKLVACSHHYNMSIWSYKFSIIIFNLHSVGVFLHLSSSNFIIIFIIATTTLTEKKSKTCFPINTDKNNFNNSIIFVCSGITNKLSKSAVV